MTDFTTRAIPASLRDVTQPSHPQARFMQAALDDISHALAREEGGPFGACLVQGDRILALAHNTVLKEKDPTCHAEINAIRLAARTLGRHELRGCVIYSTTEPCPMCFSAIHWARIDTIVYGTRIADVEALGFHELHISNQQMQRLGHSPVRLITDFMRPQCLELLQQWQTRTHGITY